MIDYVIIISIICEILVEMLEFRFVHGFDKYYLQFRIRIFVDDKQANEKFL